MLLFDIHHDYIYVDYVDDFNFWKWLLDSIVAALIGMITIKKS